MSGVKKTVAALVSVSVFTFLGAAWPSPASAQTGKIAQAESLYNQGKELIEKKQYKTACSLFLASLKLDESVNTQVALARCLELDGRTASAWGQYLVAEKMAAGKPAGIYASQQAAALVSQLLKLSVVVDPGQRGLTLKLDDESIPSESVGALIPVDPGTHTLVATATGKRPLTKSVTLSAETSPARIALVFEDLSPEELRQQAEGEKKAKVPVETVGPRVEWTPMKTAGVLVGAGGVVAGLGAIGFAVLTVVNDANRQTQISSCAVDQPCPSADDYREKAILFQTLAIVAGSVAGVAIGTGVTLMLVGGNRVVADANKTGATYRLMPAVSPTHAGLSLGGAF